MATRVGSKDGSTSTATNERDRSPARSSGVNQSAKAHSSKGSPYHLGLASLITLRAYQLQQENESFRFDVSVWNYTNGRFDDVIVRYSSDSTKGAMCVQLARETGDTQSSIALGTICHWFHTFLECQREPSTTGTLRYVVCTNGQLDGTAAPLFDETEPESDDILSFAMAISSTSYQLHRTPELVRALQDHSLTALAKQLAWHVFHLTKITKQSALFQLYAGLICICVEPAKGRPKLCYRFRAQFFDAEPGTTKAALLSALQNQYTALCRNDCVANTKTLEQCELYIEQPFLEETGEDEHRIVIATRVSDFIEQFVLVRDTNSEQTLHSRALWEVQHIHRLLSNAEQRAVLQALQAVLQQAIAATNLVGSSCVRNVIGAEGLAKNMLTNCTDQYLQKVRKRYPFIVLEKKKLKTTKLYKDVCAAVSLEEIPFCSFLDTLLVGAIVAQTLALLPSCEHIIIESLDPKVMKYLTNMLPHATELYSCSRIVLTIMCSDESGTLDKLQPLLRTRTCGGVIQDGITFNVILVDNRLAITDIDYYVRDLTTEGWKKALEHYASFALFGTRASLESLVRKEDDLQLLQSILDFIDGEDETANVNQERFASIKPWYIDRSIEPYERERYQEPSETSGMHPDFYTLHQHSFKTLAKLDGLPHRKELLKVLLSTPAPRASANGFESASGRHIMLVNESGAGTTAYLTALACQLQSQDPSLYVRRVDVSQYVARFCSLVCEDSPQEKTQTVRNLCLLMNLDNPHYATGIELAVKFCEARKRIELDMQQLPSSLGTVQQTVLLRLFQEKFNRGQLVLMLDGVEAIEGRYRCGVLKFCTSLALLGAVRNVILSLHPHCVSEMRSQATTAPCFAEYALQPFSPLDKMLLLHYYLDRHLGAYRQCEPVWQTQLPPFLLHLVQQSLGQCFDVPLLLAMAFELYLPAIKRCVNFSTRCVQSDIKKHFPLHRDRFALIKAYADSRIRVGCTDIEADRVSTLHRHHALWAINAFQRRYHFQLLTEAEQQHAEDLFQQERASMGRVGIVTEEVGKEVCFRNRTLLHYYVARWMFENRNRLENDMQAVFQSITFWDTPFTLVRYFLDRAAASASGEGMELHVALCSELTGDAGFPLMDRRYASAKDGAGRTALHLLMAMLNDPGCDDRRCRSIMHAFVRLLQWMPSALLDARDQLFHWSAIDYAFCAGRWHFIAPLLRRGAKVDVEVWSHQLLSYDLTKRMCRVKQLEDNLFHPLRRTVYDNALARQIGDGVGSRIAQHLFYSSIHSCEKEAVRDNVIALVECCTKHDIHCLTKHFMSREISPKHNLAAGGVPLLQVAKQHGAYKTMACLIEKTTATVQDFLIKPNDSFENVMSFVIMRNSMQVFKAFFRLLCAYYRIECPRDAEIDENDCTTSPAGTLAANSPELMRTGIIEKILAEALYEANFRIVIYVVQKLRLTITVDLLADVITTLRWQGRVLPEGSRRIFRYLLGAVPDSRLGQTDDIGCTLLHLAAQTGCLVMMECLRERTLDPLVACAFGGWNIFHYVAADVEDRRAVRVFKHAHPYWADTDKFNILDMEDNSVFCLAVVEGKYRLARWLVETQGHTLLPQDRVSKVLSMMEELVKIDKVEEALRFCTFLFDYPDVEWKPVYAIVQHRLPVV